MVSMGKRLFTKQVHTLVKPVIYSLIILIFLSVTSHIWGPAYSKAVGNVAISIGSENVTGEFNDNALEYTIEPDNPVEQQEKIQRLSAKKIRELGLFVSGVHNGPINYSNELEIRSMSIWLILFATFIPIAPLLGAITKMWKYFALALSCVFLNVLLLVLIFASLEIVVANPAYLATWNNSVQPLIPVLNMIPCALLIGYIVMKVKT